MILFLRLLLSYEVSIEEIHQAIEEVFDHSNKPLEVDKHTPLRVIFSTLFWVFGNVLNQGL